MAPLSFGQSFNGDIKKLLGPATLGGKYESAASSLRVVAESNVAVAQATSVNFGSLTFSRAPNTYVIPFTLSDAKDVASVRIYVDEIEHASIKTEVLTGNIVRKNEWDYDLTQIGGPGTHSVKVDIFMNDGSTSTVSGTYTVPQCPESEIFTIQPEAEVYTAILKSLVKNPQFVDHVDFYYVEFYDGKDVLVDWDPNTQTQPKASAKAYSVLRDGLATAIIRLSDTKFRGYGFVGWYVSVETTACGTKVKSDVRDFFTRMSAPFQPLTQSSSISIQILSNNDPVGGWATFRVTVDTGGKSGRLVMHTVGVTILTVPPPWWPPDWKWWNPTDFDGTFYPTFQLQPVNGPQTFTWSEWYYDDYHYTMIASLFVENGSGTYKYDQNAIQFEGRRPRWQIFPPVGCPGGCG